MTSGSEHARNKMLESRQRIDEIDPELVALLNRRAEYARLIGAAKEVLNEPTYQPRREEEIFRRAVEANRGPLDETPQSAAYSSASSTRLAVFRGSSRVDAMQRARETQHNSYRTLRCQR